MTTASGEPVRAHGETAIVDLPALVDSSAEATLLSAYAATGAAPRVLLNFTGVEFLSSTGIALIVGLLARARKEGRSVAACGLSDHYREIFEITRLADFMRIYPDEGGALAPETSIEKGI